MELHKIQDAVVVGGGLIGSASARYLALDGLRVTLIGPNQASSSTSHAVFSSHDDDTRVQRLIAHNRLWTQLNLESVRAWRGLEERTGINFYTENGCIYLAHEHDAYLSGAESLARAFGLGFTTITTKEDLHKISLALRIDAPMFGLYEATGGGMINPRNLVRAQLQEFSTAGGELLNDVVTEIIRSQGVWNVTTAGGTRYQANRVLVAAGAFSNFNNLLPKPLEMFNKSEVVVHAEVSKRDFEELSGSPSLLYEITGADFEEIYMTPPVQREDGKYVLKMGLNQTRDLNLGQRSSMVDWFTGEEFRSFGPVLKRELTRLLPDVPFLTFDYKACVISRTATGNPYIGEVETGLFVAHGCNGYSAMSSDAQGRQAAALVAKGTFGTGYAVEDFAVRFRS
jgi:sarcosine oxidase